MLTSKYHRSFTQKPANIAILLTLLFLTLSLEAFAKDPRRPQNFRKAKKHVYKIFQKLDAKTLYCGCLFTGKNFDAKSCGYIPKRAKTKKGKINHRATRIEIEHISPAHSFGQSFLEWREPKKFPECQKKNKKWKSSRKCAQKNPLFRQMESDLYNLWPTIGEINADRSNFRFAIIDGEKRAYGQCDVEIENRKVEPPPYSRGIIARAVLYMDKEYPNRGVLQKKGGQRKMFEAWHKEYPATKLEKQWAREIYKIQGNCQPFILDCASL